MPVHMNNFMKADNANSGGMFDFGDGLVDDLRIDSSILEKEVPTDESK